MGAQPRLLARVGIACESALTALMNPTRQDAVAALGEVTGLGALEEMRNNMLLSQTGRQILRERPMINSSTIDLDKLGNLPQNTFGFKYVEFLKVHQISPDTRTLVRYVNDEELAYVMTRYRQIHDLWHCLTQIPITVEGELGLKVFEYLQTGLPMTALASAFGPLRLNSAQRKYT